MAPSARRPDALDGVLARSVRERARAPAGLLQRDYLDDFLDSAGSLAKGILGGGGPKWIVDALTSGPGLATVRLMIMGGTRDENKLTNAAFFFMHPEIVPGTKIDPDKDPELANEWRAVRNKVVRPELEKLKEPEPPASEPATDSGTRPAGAPDSKTFLEQHGELLRRLPVKGDDELLLLLDYTLNEGSAVRIEYLGDAKKPASEGKHAPLMQAIFMLRHPDIDVTKKSMRIMLREWPNEEIKSNGWEGITPELYQEMGAIRNAIVFPFLRIVLPRIETATELGPAATLGDKIAHRAHVYIGVRYEMGGRYRSQGSPENKDPFEEWKLELTAAERARQKKEKEEAEKLKKAKKGKKGKKQTTPVELPPEAPRTPEMEVRNASFDCASLVRKVFADLGVRLRAGEAIDAQGSAAPLQTSDDLKPVEFHELRPGDLLFRPNASGGRHVAIYVGGAAGEKKRIIHAPQTGRVVSKDTFVPTEKWDAFRRHVDA